MRSAWLVGLSLLLPAVAAAQAPPSPPPTAWAAPFAPPVPPAEYVGIRAMASTSSASESEFIPLLNVNIGWSF